MVKDIITDINELEDRCDEINILKENNLLRDIIINLKETCRENNLVGLSAPQIGYKKRVFVINFNGDIRTFINPIITSLKGFTLSRQECPSLPNKQYIRPRYTEIGTMYQTPLSKTESRKLIGKAAEVFQQQLDYLDGLLLSDVGLEIGEDFLNASDEEKQQVINLYLESLDLKQKDVEKEIEEDEMLKKTKDAVEFMEAVQKGEVKLGETITRTKEAKEDDVEVNTEVNEEVNDQ